MIKIIFVLLSGSMLVFSVQLNAQTSYLPADIYKEGITSASIRAIGMGGAFVHIADENPAYYNPAVVFNIKRYSLVNNSAFLLGKGKYLFGNSSIVRFDEHLFFSLSVVTDTDTDVGYTVTGGYALPLGESFTLGFNAKAKALRNTAGIGCDAGLYGNYSIITFGAMIQDLATIVGGSLEPTQIKLAAGAKPIWDLSVNLQADFAIIYENPIYMVTRLRFGLERNFFNDLLGARLGYIYSLPDQSSVAAGLGIKFKDFSLNYAFTCYSREGVFLENENTHWICASLYFWPKSAEEIRQEKERRLRKQEIAKVKIEHRQTEQKESAAGVQVEPSPAYEYPKTTKTGSNIESLQIQLELKELKIYAMEMEKQLRQTKEELEKLKIQTEDRELNQIVNELPREVFAQKSGSELILRVGIDLLFEQQDSSDLKSGAAAVLDRICEALKRYPQYLLKIKGYTNNKNNEQENVSLSLAQAKEVAGYIQKKGIYPQRFIETDGFGSKNPIASDITDTGKTQNRRVEIILSK